MTLKIARALLKQSVCRPMHSIESGLLLKILYAISQELEELCFHIGVLIELAIVNWDSCLPHGILNRDPF